MFSSITQSTYHNWIRSDYYTLSQLLFIYKKTAQPSDLAYANLTQWVTATHNSLYRLKLSGQSYTSPILRWTGNSPMWEKITVQTRGSSMYDFPTHTADCPARITNQVHHSELVNYPELTYRPNVCYKENDRPRGRPLYSPQNFSKDLREHLRRFLDSEARHTCRRKSTSRAIFINRVEAV